jgi:hypothetical protein
MLLKSTIVALLLCVCANAKDLPWEDGTVTAVSRISVPRGSASEGFGSDWALEYTIGTSTTIWVVRYIDPHQNSKAVVAKGPFPVGDTIHFQIKEHAHYTGRNMLIDSLHGSLKKRGMIVVRETPR